MIICLEKIYDDLQHEIDHTEGANNDSSKTAIAPVGPVDNDNVDRQHLKIWGADDADNPNDGGRTVIAPVDPVDSNDNNDNGDVVNGGDDNVSGVDGGGVKCGRAYTLQQRAIMDHARQMRNIAEADDACETKIRGFMDTRKKEFDEIFEI